MRLSKLIFTIIVFFVIAACRITGEYEISQEGKGKGNIRVEDFNKNIFLTRLNEDDRYKKLEITSVDSISPDVFEVNIKWNDFQDVFNSLKHLDDGYIELDLGSVDFPFTVSIDGSIDKARSTGEILKKDKIRFKTGKAIVTYKPTEEHGIFKSFFIGVAVILVYLIFFRKKKSAEKSSGISN